MAGFALNRSRQAPAEDTPAFGGIAERFRRAGDLDRAIALCREGLKKFPNQLSARVTLGWSLLDQGKFDQAQAELEQVLRRAPDNLAAIRGLAELHERTENSLNLSSMDGQGAWPIEPEGDEHVGSDEIPAATATSGVALDPSRLEESIAEAVALPPATPAALPVASFVDPSMLDEPDAGAVLAAGSVGTEQVLDSSATATDVDDVIRALVGEDPPIAAPLVTAGGDDWADLGHELGAVALHSTDEAAAEPVIVAAGASAEDELAGAIAELEETSIGAPSGGGELVLDVAGVPDSLESAEVVVLSDLLEQERLEEERLAAELAEEKRLKEERLAAERAEQRRIVAELAEEKRLKQERIAAERAEKERLKQERLAAERAEKDRREQERLAAERAEQERLAAEQERIEQERLAAERAEQERIEQERLAAECAEQERLEQERLAAERAEQERLEQERLAAERAEQERLEQERLAAERAEQERLEQERLAAERAEQERIEQERLAAERAEQERIEQERLAAERAEQERIEQERLAAERAERERIEQERLAAERAEQERIEQERIAAERAEEERREQQRLVAEQLEHERLAAERAEQERIELERLAEELAALERDERERAERDRIEQELTAERLTAERVEQERLGAERAEEERLELERLAEEIAALERAERDRAAASPAAGGTSLEDMVARSDRAPGRATADGNDDIDLGDVVDFGGGSPAVWHPPAPVVPLAPTNGYHYDAAVIPPLIMTPAARASAIAPGAIVLETRRPVIALERFLKKVDARRRELESQSVA